MASHSVEHFDYHLPEHRIAVRPLERRDAAKLLVSMSAQPHVLHSRVRELPSHLSEGSLVIMNNSRVVPARLHLRKPTGGMVEVFILEPAERGHHAESLAKGSSQDWMCLIGGRGVRDGMVLHDQRDGCTLTATVISRHSSSALLRFSWDTDKTFSQILATFGGMPLPPYLKREDDAADKERYQTVYARVEGSVAAPTAGLHLSDEVLNECTTRNIAQCAVTLHVGLGTFVPMKHDNVEHHVMHSEYASVQRSSVMQIREHLLRVRSGAEARTVCIGTTSLRTAESLHWLGVGLLSGRMREAADLEVTQWCWKESPAVDVLDSLAAVIAYMDERGITDVHFPTGLMIAPGYTFAVCDTLLTNFHQPKSTLLVLVSGFVGDERRRSIYDEAMNNDYRFLSYGDASLLFR